MHIALRVAGGTRGMTELAEDVWVVPTPGSASTLRGCLSKARAKLVAAGGAAEELTRTVRLSGGRSIVTSPPSGTLTRTGSGTGPPPLTPPTMRGSSARPGPWPTPR